MKITMLTQQRVMKPEIIHPVVIEDGQRMLLVDCGDPELAFTLCREMREKGLEPSRLTDILITHHDLDHMGGLSGFRDLFPSVNVMSTAFQAEYICGAKRWLRLQEEDRSYLACPPEQRVPSGRVRAAQYLYFLPAQVDTLVQDGDVLPFDGGIHVLETPWHMPGHLSLYLPAEKTLISGDAFNTFNGVLDLNRAVDLCPEQTAAGLRRLKSLDVEAVYGYHGGLLQLKPGIFDRRLEELLATL